MKKKSILIIFILLLIVTGCGKKEDDKKAKKESYKTKISCSKDFFLFHEKQHLKNIIYLDKNNKLVDYEYIESYSDFDSDEEYNKICDGSKDEAENNTKLYPYLTQSSKCDESERTVAITNKYDMSKVTSKNNLEGTNMKKYLNDEYVLDLENYKNDITNKGYKCE